MCWMYICCSFVDHLSTWTQANTGLVPEDKLILAQPKLFRHHHYRARERKDVSRTWHDILYIALMIWKVTFWVLYFGERLVAN